MWYEFFDWLIIHSSKLNSQLKSSSNTDVSCTSDVMFQLLDSHFMKEFEPDNGEVDINVGQELRESISYVSLTLM
jgi:hypothetical protein